MLIDGGCPPKNRGLSAAKSGILVGGTKVILRTELANFSYLTYGRYSVRSTENDEISLDCADDLSVPIIQPYKLTLRG